MTLSSFISVTVGLFLVSLEQCNAYQGGRHSFQLHRRSALQSTISSATDNLAASVLESGKEVKKLKFEPIFKSFAQNQYFVSYDWTNSHHIWSWQWYEGIASHRTFHLCYRIFYNSYRMSGRRSPIMSAPHWIVWRAHIQWKMCRTQLTQISWKLVEGLFKRVLGAGTWLLYQRFDIHALMLTQTTLKSLYFSILLCYS